MVPEATFTSYYGRPVVKPSPWEDDIPAYLFLGGLAAGSSLLAAGADLTGRPALRRAGRLGALGGISRAACVALVHDLGRPEPVRQHAAGGQADLADVGRHLDPHRVRAAAPGWPARAEIVAAAARRLRRRLGRLLDLAARPAGARRPALVAPAVASYTAVLLADTATPAWHEAYRELPFVFVGSAAAASGGLGMVARPAARGRTGAAARRRRCGCSSWSPSTGWSASMGLTAEPLHTGPRRRLMRASKVADRRRRGRRGLLLGRRSRVGRGRSPASR